MTEKPNPNVEKILAEIASLKKSLPEQFEKKIQEIRELIKQNVMESEKTEASKETKGHESVEAMLACENCGPKASKLVRRQLSNDWKDKRLGKCKGCGLIVSEDEEKCPDCGRTEAERI